MNVTMNKNQKLLAEFQHNNIIDHNFEENLEKSKQQESSIYSELNDLSKQFESGTSNAVKPKDLKLFAGILRKTTFKMKTLENLKQNDKASEANPNMTKNTLSF